MISTLKSNYAAARVALQVAIKENQAALRDYKYSRTQDTEGVYNVTRKAHKCALLEVKRARSAYKNALLIEQSKIEA